MNRAQLEAAVARYLQFTSLEVMDLDMALDRTRQENAALRVPENAVSVGVTPDAGRFPLPANFRTMRRLTGAAGEVMAGAFALTDALGRNYNGPPTLYNIEGDFVSVNSSSTAQLELSYWAIEDRLGDDADATTPILTAYPGLFIHRCVGEIGLITQDAEIAAVHLQQYDRLYDRIQRSARYAQGGRGLAAYGG